MAKQDGTLWTTVRVRRDVLALVRTIAWADNVQVGELVERYLLAGAGRAPAAPRARIPAGAIPRDRPTDHNGMPRAT